jgi:hypothetical protein
MARGDVRLPERLPKKPLVSKMRGLSPGSACDLCRQVPRIHAEPMFIVYVDHAASGHGRGDGPTAI